MSKKTTKELTEIEILQLEAFGKDKAINDLRKKDMSQQRQIVSLHQKLQQLELIIKEKNLMQELGKLEAQSKSNKSKRKAFLESIRNKYEIEGEWGYSPETGEIILEGDEEE